MNDATQLRGVRVLRVGHFDPDYSRNRVIGKVLRRAGAEVVDLSLRVPFARRAGRVFSAVRRSPADLLFVPCPAHGDVAVTRLASELRRGRRAPLVFDPLFPLHEMMVVDRGRVSPGSLAARRYRLEDRFTCRLADLVLVDTEAHLHYFARESGLSRERFRRLWVGSDDEVMRPAPRVDDGVFRVMFCGTAIPLHGIEHIIDAAVLLERRGVEHELLVVGEGQTHAADRERARRAGLRSVRFLGAQPYESLPGLMAQSDVCLGVFGTGEKTRRVVPTKLFDALAVERAVVTGDTPAVREALRPDEEVLLVPVGDPEALAEALVALRDDPERRAALAAAGRFRFGAEFSIAALGRALVPVLRALLDR